MMKKKMVRPIAILLSCLLMLLLLQPCFCINADELDEPVEPEDDFPYVYVDDANCTLYISSGTAYVTSYFMEQSGAGVSSSSVTVYLEKYIGDSWQTYTSWYHSGGASQNNSDSTSVSHGIYRVRMSVSVATNNGGRESFDVGGNMVMYLL